MSVSLLSLCLMSSLYVYISVSSLLSFQLCIDKSHVCFMGFTWLSLCFTSREREFQAILMSCRRDNVAISNILHGVPTL